jgi:leucyl-tRNA synthetase
LVGLLREQQCTEHGIVTDLVKMIAPFAPHFAEECWERLGHRSSVFDAAWPTWDEALTVDDVVTVAVQVNGRTRATVTLDRGASEDDARNAAMADASVARHLADREIRKVIWVPGRMLSFVVT